MKPTSVPTKDHKTIWIKINKGPAPSPIEPRWGTNLFITIIMTIRGYKKIIPISVSNNETDFKGKHLLHLGIRPSSKLSLKTLPHYQPMMLVDGQDSIDYFFDNLSEIEELLKTNI